MQCNRYKSREPKIGFIAASTSRSRRMSRPATLDRGMTGKEENDFMSAREDLDARERYEHHREMKTRRTSNIGASEPVHREVHRDWGQNYRECLADERIRTAPGETNRKSGKGKGNPKPEGTKNREEDDAERNYMTCESKQDEEIRRERTEKKGESGESSREEHVSAARGEKEKLRNKNGLAGNRL